MRNGRRRETAQEGRGIGCYWGWTSFDLGLLCSTRLVVSISKLTSVCFVKPVDFVNIYIIVCLRVFTAATVCKNFTFHIITTSW